MIPEHWRNEHPEMDEAQLEAVSVWWEAYSASIRNRTGNHPTNQLEAEQARDAGFAAVIALVNAENDRLRKGIERAMREGAMAPLTYVYLDYLLKGKTID